ncbi:omega-amidase NIT2 isoform X1 [Nilaparvata lugens]|uniref:omega-amidase NIT2 isoform X1 n=2 Tax=Nilaparvata lugens TaxID=108931 RepID=UPI00193EBC00|nr:omega-amidase NIT2 isoform X1 [Nilaparvata lugens]
MLTSKMASFKGLRVALIQMLVGEDKSENLKKAVNLITEAKKENPRLVALPECFNSPYGTKFFPEYAEPIPEGETCSVLSETAKKNNLYLVGGSIPEKCGDKFYNTCTVWSPEGKLIGLHRKMHLFDIDVKGGVRFCESDVLSSGNKLTTFDVDQCKVGVAICYDIRFSEMTKLYRKLGVDLLIYPAAFNTTTGPLHWELLARARAVDEQVFVAAVSPAQDLAADYKAYGHTILVSPWGKVLHQAEFAEKTIIADIDLNEVTNIRQQIPTFSQRRTELYDTIAKSSL